MIIFAKGLVIYRYSVFATVGKIPSLPPQNSTSLYPQKPFFSKHTQNLPPLPPYTNNFILSFTTPLTHPSFTGYIRN